MARLIENRIQFPYKRSLGPVFGAFMTALAGRKIIGIRNGDRVLAPPLEWDPDTGEELAPRLRRRRPRGHGHESGRGCPSPTEQHPLDRAVRLRARSSSTAPTTSILHAVDAGSDRRHERPACGSRPAGGPSASAHITDIEAFVPGEEPDVPEGDAGERREEPVTMMEYNASITYTEPGPGQRRARAEQANDEGRFLGQQCPVCGRTYTGGRGLLPDRLGRAHRGARGRPARSAASSPTTRSSRRCSTRARPRPSRSPGCTSGSTAPTCPRVPGALDVPERRHPRRHAGRGDVGLGGGARRPTAHPPPTAASSAGCPPASPTTRPRPRGQDL